MTPIILETLRDGGKHYLHGLLFCPSRLVQHSSVRHYYIHLLRKTWAAWQQVSPGVQAQCLLLWRLQIWLLSALNSVSIE